MPLNWGHLLRQARRSFLGTRGTNRRLTAHRFLVLTVFWILFIPHQLATRFCFLLDNIFFPNWRRTPVDKPVFIIGLFRSGTTFLHRLLAGDQETFSAMKTWEIYLAPSILQRKFLRFWKKLDRAMGSPAMRWLERYNERNLGQVQFHKVGLWKEEEDEGLLVFLWDSLFTWFFFPDTAGIEDYMFADREMSPRRQRRKFAFYEACLKRHLYCHPGSPIYLSKNPAFTPKVASLKEAFADGRFVYLVRDPARVLVSQAAWFSFCWHYFASPMEPYPFKKEMLAMTRHWYSYPLDILETWNPEDYLIVEYKNLITNPVETIRTLYEHFDLAFSQDFQLWLEKESRKTEEYANSNTLSIEEVGFDADDIARDFAFVYQRFDFRHAAE